MPEQLVVFHYHFLPGGVTSVVEGALDALRSHLPRIGEILLVAGRFSPQLRLRAAQQGVRLRELADVDYRSPKGLSPDRVAAEAGPLAERLGREFAGPGRIWWVHNHHLGKNPVFTEALLRVLSSRGDQRAVLQIHDFPECGRLSNLRLLRRTLGSNPYPAGANLRYAVLSARDRGVLLQAGLPADCVHVLENPVTPAAPVDGERSDCRRALAEAFPEAAASFDPERRLLLYPVRSIRRKNVLEATLLARLLGEQASLVVTLPGVSVAERRYSGLVARAFQDGLCPGVWGAGRERDGAAPGLSLLAGASDLVVSTSVQEGFGFLFVNALQWARPLAARRLEILAEMETLLAAYPACLYDTLRCPLRRSEALRVRRAYAKKLRALAGLYDRSTLERLHEEVPAVIGHELGEFSFLPVPLQLDLLRGVARGERLGPSREANAPLLAALRELPRSGPRQAAAAVQARFGARAFARSFGALIDDFGRRAGPPPREDGQLIQERILRRFARLENLRLLYDF